MARTKWSPAAAGLASAATPSSAYAGVLLDLPPAETAPAVPDALRSLADGDGPWRGERHLHHRLLEEVADEQKRRASIVQEALQRSMMTICRCCSVSSIAKRDEAAGKDMRMPSTPRTSRSTASPTSCAGAGGAGPPQGRLHPDASRRGCRRCRPRPGAARDRGRPGRRQHDGRDGRDAGRDGLRAGAQARARGRVEDRRGL